MNSLKIADITLTWLDGGVCHLDGGAMFGVVPKPLWEKRYPCNEKNQIQLRNDPILIQADGKNLLIETGIGQNKMSDKQKRNYGLTRESHIKESLAELGLTTADIDYVMMTHMHFDHACGLTEWRNEELVSTFGNAVILSSKTEWDEVRNPNIRSQNTYWEENWQAIVNQVETFKEEIEVLSGIKMIHTGGHSNGHSIISIERNGEKLIHMADIMPTHAHQNVLWVLAFDDYPMDSIEAKQQWLKYGLENEVWYVFYHDAYYRAIKWDQNGQEIDSIKVALETV